MEAIDKLRELSKKLEDPYFVKEFEEDFEKFLKERDMKIYHTATQYDYETLMIELEEKGYLWLSGDKPTSKDYWSEDKENSCVRISGEDITSGSLDCYKEEYPNENIIEYRAKGENMEEEEMKHKLQEAVKSFARGISESEKDLQKAKTSAKSLIEKIYEYFKTLKPKFKVGDYVTDTSDDDPFICKIEKFEGNDISGIWYCVSKKLFFDKLARLPISNSRASTKEEIAEYEVALTFHKRGRKPFEVKEGDIISDSEEEKIFVDVSGFWDKEDFTSGDYTLVKTAEEYNEWIENK